MDDNSLMQRAIKEAYKGIEALHGGPFGAVISRGDKIISFAHNLVLKENDPTAHAEIRAISIASRSTGSFDLSGCRIFTTTEPCPMCFSAIHWARIDEVVFGTHIKDVSERGFNELVICSDELKRLSGSPVEIKAGVMKAECEELLEYWDTMPNKTVY